jgi:glucose-1-phosphate thymidylyltransferase
LNRGFAWLDAGTSSSLNEASVRMSRRSKNARASKSAVPKKPSFRSGFLSLAQLENILTEKIPNCEYRDYLRGIVAEAKRLLPLKI